MVLLVLNQVTDKQDVKWIYFLHIKPAISRQRVRDSDHMVEHIYFLKGLLRLVLDEFAIVTDLRFLLSHCQQYRRIIEKDHWCTLMLSQSAVTWSENSQLINY